MSENDTVSHPKPPPNTLTLPPRSGFEAMFTGSDFGLSPGPMTLVSNLFSDSDSDSNFRSFSQLLAGIEPDTVPFKENPNVVQGQNGNFNMSSGLSPPGPLAQSPRLFPAQGSFGMSHQHLLAQVTAQAEQAETNLHMQMDFQPTLGVGLSTSTPFPGFNSQSSFQQNTSKEPPQFSGCVQRSQPSSSTIVDKPANDGYNWRKYGQKQVKGSEFPRSYYKCTHPNCPVRKKVERSLDGQVIEIIYKGQHNHDPPKKRSKDGGNHNYDLVIEGNPQNGNSASESMAYSFRRDQESSLATEEHLSSDDEVGDDGIRESGGCEDEPDAKRRNTEVRVSEEAALHRTVTEPRIIVQATSEVDLLDDGYRWRKYGQKVVKGNPYPRSYYKCTFAGCNVRKHVERAATDPKAVVTTYEGKHNHDIPAARTSSHNTAYNNATQIRPSTSRGNTNPPAHSNQQSVARLRLKDERLT